MSLRIYPTPERCGCPLPENIPAQAGWGSEHPDLVEDVLIAGGLHFVAFTGPFQPKPFHGASQPDGGNSQ